MEEERGGCQVQAREEEGRRGNSREMQRVGKVQEGGVQLPFRAEGKGGGEDW